MSAANAKTDAQTAHLHFSNNIRDDPVRFDAPEVIHKISVVTRISQVWGERGGATCERTQISVQTHTYTHTP